MAYRDQSSFSAGELDPALFKRTDLEKWRTGLATLRNAFIGKSGRIISRGGTTFVSKTQFPASPSVIFSPPYSDFVLEVGVGSIKAYFPGQFDTFLANSTLACDYTAGDIPNIHFVPASSNRTVTRGNLFTGTALVYLFCKGKQVKRLRIGTTFGIAFDVSDESALTDIFHLPAVPIFKTKDANSGAGYAVDYAVTYVFDGQESDFATYLSSTSSLLKPDAAGQINTFTFTMPANIIDANLPRVSELRVYQRPAVSIGGNAYGFIGSAPGGSRDVQFNDVGTAADFTHAPPASIPISGLTSIAHANLIKSVTSKTGAIHQQRLIMSDDVNSEAIYASRTGFLNSFFAESTLTADSALAFKAGATGSANVLRLFDSPYGLLVFTTVGVFQNSGALGPDNLGLNKVSTLVIQENVPPLEVPGGIICVDKSTNSIQSLVYSYVEQTFPPDELSIYSNHLFAGRKVVSWAFQDGDIPLVWVVMDDGSLLSLTYKREQQMRAWARHDSDGGLFECVTVRKDLNNQSIVYFQVNRDGTRMIESMVPRTLGDIKDFIGMDCTFNFKTNLNIATGAISTIQEKASFNIFPEDVNNWNGRLRIKSSRDTFITNLNSALDTGVLYSVFDSVSYPVYYNIKTLPNGINPNNNGYNNSGLIDPTHPLVLTFFDKAGSKVDLNIVEMISLSEIVVEPSVEFPSGQTVNVQLYQTYGPRLNLGLILSGGGSILQSSPLEGKEVSLLVDGYVMGSPNNNDQNYNSYRVTDGYITLDNDSGLGAIIHAGLPFTSDVETLDIDTVEQKPIQFEAKIVNRLYIDVINTRGFYVASEFADNDQVDNMVIPETRHEDPVLGIVGNRAQGLIRKRYDLSVPNDWRSNGRVCIRQVDPLPFEILAISPDLEVFI